MEGPPYESGETGEHGLMVPDVLVGEDEIPAARDPLSEQVYTKLKRNRFFEAQPNVVQFSGYIVGNVHQQVVRIRNISGVTKRLHVLPMKTSFFRILYHKRGKVAPGMAEEVLITFTPNEWRYYYDRIRIHSDDENIMIPVHAFPTVAPVTGPPLHYSDLGVGNDMGYFPTKIDMGRCQLNAMVTREIPILCDVPVEFEFNIKVLVPHADMNVSPLEGVVPAEGQAVITFSYKPSIMATAQMTIEINISQFGFKPVRCTVIGSTGPATVRDATVKTLTQELQQSGKVGPKFNFECYAPVPKPSEGRPDLFAVHDYAKGFQEKLVALREQRKPGQPIEIRRPVPPPPEPETELDGYRIPANLHTRAAAQFVLSQVGATSPIPCPSPLSQPTGPLVRLHGGIPCPPGACSHAASRSDQSGSACTTRDCFPRVDH